MGLSDIVKRHRPEGGRRLSWGVLAACVVLLLVAFGLGTLLGSGDALRRIIAGCIAMLLASMALWIVSLVAVVVVSAVRAKRDARSPSDR